MRKRLVSFFAAAIVCGVVVPALPQAAEGVQVTFTGTAMQMMQLDGRYFQKEGSDIIGLAFPVTVLCPGGLDFATGTCAPSPADGLQGIIVAVENVVRRNVGVAGMTPTFEMRGEQMFSGWLMSGGQRHYGTLMLYMQFGGPLRTPAIDCYNTPHDLACGAAAFSGTWTIMRGESGGDLRGVSGNGTIEWRGCRDPNDVSTCSMPEFTGVVVMRTETEGNKGPKRVGMP